MRWSPTIALAAAIVGLLVLVPAARAVELVRDGGFEGGPDASPWVQRDNRNTSSICGPGAGCGLMSTSGPRTGRWWNWFGGADLFPGQHHRSSLSQTIAATAGTPLTLSFWLWTGFATDATAINVSLDDQVLFAARGDDPRYGQGYVPVVVPVDGSLVTGGAQTLRFAYDGISGFLTFYAINIDDVSLTAPDTDLGVGLASAPTTVTQGATFGTTIIAGNGGPHSASDVRVEYPLPTGATLVGLTGEGSCSATETAPGHVMHCDFGSVSPGASKAVHATMRADAVGTITQHAALPTRTGDPNGANHVAQAAVTVVAPPSTPTPPTPKPPTCTAARKFTVPLRKGSKGTALMIGKHTAAKARILSARLTGPKPFKTRKLEHTRSRVTVDLRKFAAGRYTVRARVRVSSRKTLNVTRTYVSCGATATSSKSSPSKSKKTKKTSAKK